MTAPRVIELVEYAPRELPVEALSPEQAGVLDDRYAQAVAVDPPWRRPTWRLTAQGYVGYIPVDDTLHLALQPKVPLGNLFRMLEYAYRVGDFDDGLVSLESLAELYERLAVLLAKRILERGRRGYYRAYVPHEERAAVVRGRLDVRRLAAAPWDPQPYCHYQEHTADVEDNRILAWTLYTVAHSGLCRPAALATVRQAYRSVGTRVALEEIEAARCRGRLYHRLNEDYRPLHALCRFFLDNSGPGYRQGERAMVPFLVDMARLFETFVAEWLAAHIAPGLRFRAQRQVLWDRRNAQYSQIDLLMEDEATGVPLCVLDTKYKAANGPSDDDVYQIIFYALAVGCREAILIYPRPLARPTDTTIQGIRLRTLAFSLAGDLDAAGAALLAELASVRTDAEPATP